MPGLCFSGADSIRIVNNWGLELVSSIGSYEFDKPRVYQIDNGDRIQLPWLCDYYMIDDTTVGFTLGNYDPAKTLVIEVGKVAQPENILHLNSPEWSMYFGGSGDDEGTAVEVDTDGNPYFTGYTESNDFPIHIGSQIIFGGMTDVFVAKFGSANGVSFGMVPQADERLWATYYGGSNIDKAFAIHSNGDGTNGTIYITGTTKSTDFPNNQPSSEYYQSALSGNSDAFIIGLDNQNGGSIYRWASFYGGNGTETGKSIKTDGSGNVFIAGSTSSDFYSSDNCSVPTDNGFPACNTTYSFDNNGYGGGVVDGFIVEFSSAGQLLWSSFYGGSDEDSISAISINGNDDLYITGKTASSSDFPIVTHTGSYNQGVFGGGKYDAFIAEFKGGNLNWCSYFGGSGDDEEGRSIVTDSDNNIYVGGKTNSSTPACTTCICTVPPEGEFPLCPVSGAYFQGSGNLGIYGGGAADGFIAKFNYSGELSWGTYYGGNEVDRINGLDVDYANQIFFTGQTFSNSPNSNINFHPGGTFWTQPGLNGTSDAFLGFFDASNIRMWSSYFSNYSGATQDEAGNSIAVFATDLATNHFQYLTGFTNSFLDMGQGFYTVSFPCCSTHYAQLQNGNGTSGGKDAIVVRFSLTGMWMPYVQEIYENLSNALIFPNPVTNFINIEMNLDKLVHIQYNVYSMLGQLLEEKKLGKQLGKFSHAIDFSSYSEGMYLLQLKANDEVVNKKIIKYE